MTRRSVTTIRAEVTMRLPPGVKSNVALEYIRSAVKSYAGGMDPQDPMAAVARDSITVSLKKRETVYL